MKTNSYLAFINGQCETAFKFYEQCLGGQIVMMVKYGDTPLANEMSPEASNSVAHARLIVGDNLLMGGDNLQENYTKPQGYAVSLNVDTAEEADKLFSALSEKGTVQMPIEETFWAIRFGMLTDQFGTPWMINCEKAA